MAEIDLNELELAELKLLYKNVEKAIASFEDRRRNDALSAAEEAVKKFGFSLSDLGVSAPKPSKRQKGEAKYRNPDDDSQTWSGRGRKPGWVQAALDAGRPLEDLAI